MPNDYSGIKQVREMNGQQFIEDFKSHNTVGVLLPAGTFFEIRKSDLWSEARTRRVAYVRTDSVFANGRVVMAIYDCVRPK